MLSFFRRPIMAPPTISQRFRLWIDAVGGFVVCLADEVTLGQAVPKHDVDIAIQGDISRRHAKIQRRGEGYFLQPLQTTSVQGIAIREPELLTSGDLVTLGRTVRLQFRKPSPLSATAVLALASHHRLEPSADGVLLMGDSCILGPGPGCHIVCPDWTRELVLFRRGAELFIRADEQLEIDGAKVKGKGKLSRTSRVVGEQFSMSFEEL
jgi:hypothetical protein